MRWAPGLLLLFTGFAAGADDYDRAPIYYSRARPRNVVSQLDARLAQGKVKLRHDPKLGYLPALLSELKVPVSSQVLVYSKTSLQRRRISPATPRALYFSDDVYVGYCQDGDVLEVSATDSKLGAVFYVVEQSPDRKPRLTRQTDTCTLCHANSRTHGVPGHVVRSVYPDTRGEAVLSGGSIRVDQTTPFAKRWGGWYATGTHGKAEHLGNLIVRTRRVEFPVDNRDGLNLTDLSKRFDTKAYLSAHSDLVALQVLAHQAEAHNLITKANFSVRQALYQERELNREMKEAPDHRWGSTTTRIRSAGDDLLQYLLFCEEATPGETLKGTSEFAREFTRQGPRDSKDRSLRDFDLKRRLFRYPCSYLIYSESFDALPAPVRDYVLERLWKVLTGRDQSKEFSHLSTADRKAIREILVETKKKLPAYWKK